MPQNLEVVLGTQLAMEHASQTVQDSKIEKYLEWLKGELIKTLLGGSMVSVNILATGINPIIANLSVDKGMDLVIKTIEKLFDIWSDSPPPPLSPPDKIRIEDNRVVIIDDDDIVVLHKRKKHPC